MSHLPNLPPIYAAGVAQTSQAARQQVARQRRTDRAKTQDARAEAVEAEERVQGVKEADPASDAGDTAGHPRLDVRA